MPTQENGFDCGVFACLYAYAMYLLTKKIEFTYNELAVTGYSDEMVNAVSNSKEFEFGMEEVGRFRADLRTLLGKLSAKYLEWDSMNN